MTRRRRDASHEPGRPRTSAATRYTRNREPRVRRILRNMTFAGRYWEGKLPSEGGIVLEREVERDHVVDVEERRAGIRTQIIERDRRADGRIV